MNSFTEASHSLCSHIWRFGTRCHCYDHRNKMCANQGSSVFAVFWQLRYTWSRIWKLWTGMSSHKWSVLLQVTAFEMKWVFEFRFGAVKFVGSRSGLARTLTNSSCVDCVKIVAVGCVEMWIFGRILMDTESGGEKKIPALSNSSYVWTESASRLKEFIPKPL